MNQEPKHDLPISQESYFVGAQHSNTYSPQTSLSQPSQLAHPFQLNDAIATQKPSNNLFATIGWIAVGIYVISTLVTLGGLMLLTFEGIDTDVAIAATMTFVMTGVIGSGFSALTFLFCRMVLQMQRKGLL